MPINYRFALNEVVRAVPQPSSGRVRDEAKTALRIAQEYGSALNTKGWPHALRQGYARNGGGYKTGQATFTKDSRTVSGSGTVWASTHVGWHILAVTGREEIYEVVAVASGTSLTLDRPYEGDTNAGTEYRLYDPYAILPADVHQLRSIQYEYGDSQMVYMDVNVMLGDEPRPGLFGETNQTAYSFGPPTTSARYSSSTVTIARGDATVTLAAGAFPDWIRNRHIRFGNEEALYKIASRTDDSNCELDRVYGGDWAGASKAYAIDPPGALRIRLHHPQEDQFSFKIEYFAAPQVLVNDADLLEGGDGYGRALIELAKGYVLGPALPWETMAPEQQQMWRTRQESYDRRGVGLLQAMIGGNVAPEQDAALINVVRGG